MAFPLCFSPRFEKNSRDSVFFCQKSAHCYLVHTEQYAILILYKKKN